MAGGAPEIRMEMQGARATLRAFSAMPKVANDELRAASKLIAATLATQIAQAGRSQGRQAALLASTVKPRQDRTPVVVIGGAAQIGHAWPARGRGRAYELVFGSEFGGKGHGFLPHQGKRGTWIFPTVERSEPEITRAWEQAAQRIADKFGEV